MDPFNLIYKCNLSLWLSPLSIHAICLSFILRLRSHLVHEILFPGSSWVFVCWFLSVLWEVFGSVGTSEEYLRTNFTFRCFLSFKFRPNWRSHCNLEINFIFVVFQGRQRWTTDDPGRQKALDVLWHRISWLQVCAAPKPGHLRQRSQLQVLTARFR